MDEKTLLFSALSILLIVDLSSCGRRINNLQDMNYVLSIITIDHFLKDIMTNKADEQYLLESDFNISMASSVSQCMVAGGDHNDNITFGEARSGAYSFTAVCSVILPRSPLEDMFYHWTENRRFLEHVEIKCSRNELKNTAQSAGQQDTIRPGSCTCLDFSFSMQQAGFKVDRMHACNNITSILTPHYFNGLGSLKTLLLADLHFSRIAPNAFADLKSLKLLSLSYSQFGSDGLPSGLLCTTNDLKVLILRGNNFNKFPSQIFDCSYCKTMTSACLSKLRKVQIDDTNITTIPTGVVDNMTNLKTFQMTSNNLLQYLDCGIFGYMPNVTDLFLSHNSISLLCNETFHNLTGLIVVDIGYNELSYLNIDWFAKAELLQILSVRGNNILHIDGSLSIFKQLEYFSAAGNKLRSLSNYTFSHSELYCLEIQDNEIEDIAYGAFHGVDNLIFLNMSNNQLHDLKQLTIYNLPNLHDLLLSHNNLTCIPQFAFENISTLQCLVLNNNNISKLYWESFWNLDFLDILFLENNFITELFGFAFYFMNHTRMIFLGGNLLNDLNAVSFLFWNNTVIDTINLSNNNLTHLKGFSMYGIFKNVYLSGNAIHKFEPNTFLDSNVVMKLLNFSNNNLASFNCINPDPFENLESLYLDYNIIQIITSKTFCYMPNLHRLSLSHNNINVIQLGSFLSVPNVQDLDLSNNFLNIDFSMNVFEGLTTPIHSIILNNNNILNLKNLFLHISLRQAHVIRLSNNPITSVPLQPNDEDAAWHLPISITTQTLELSFCNITHISSEAFSNMANPYTIDLRHNQLTSFQEFQFHKRGAYFTVSIDFRDNPIKCSCNMKWLKERALPRKLYKLTYCHHMSRHNMVRFLDIPSEEFVCLTKVNCDTTSCDCFTVDPSGGNPTIANCSSKQLSQLPHPLPPTANIIYLQHNNFSNLDFNMLNKHMTTQKLFLNNCKIHHLAVNTFYWFKYLEVLHLHHNYIEYLSETMFVNLYKLTALTIHNNRLVLIEPLTFVHQVVITSLTLHDNSLEIITNDTRSEISSMLYLSHLTLHYNPWRCECDNLTWKDWLLQMSDKLKFLDQIVCVNGTAVVSTPDHTFLCYAIPFYVETIIEKFLQNVIISTCSAIILLIIFIGLVSVYYYRYILAVLIYNASGIRFKQHKEEEKPFDIFCAYDKNEDNILPYIIRPITGILEEATPPLKCFIPERDILPGSVWTEELYKGIHSSSRALFFLTEKSLKSEEFLHIFLLSYNNMINSKIHSLMFIIPHEMQHLIKSKIVNPKMKAFMHTNNYLVIGEKLFWKRLMYFVPGKRNYKQIANIHNEMQMTTMVTALSWNVKHKNRNNFQVRF